MSDDLSLLQHLAEAATPGEWSVAGLSASPDRVLGPFSVDRIADAEFIAAANPTVVLALIERVRKAEALLDRDRLETIFTRQGLRGIRVTLANAILSLPAGDSSEEATGEV